MSVAAAAALESFAAPREGTGGDHLVGRIDFEGSVEIGARFVVPSRHASGEGAQKIVATCRSGQTATAVGEGEGEVGALRNERSASERGQRLPMSFRIEEEWLKAIKGRAKIEHVHSTLAGKSYEVRSGRIPRADRSYGVMTILKKFLFLCQKYTAFCRDQPVSRSF